MPANTDPTSPYRPPEPSEGETPTRVCPDCMTDLEHCSEGGVRPIDEFRLAPAKGYANGVRRAAYCRYHEAKRERERKARRPAEGAPRKKYARRSTRKDLKRERGRRERALAKTDPERMAKRQRVVKEWEDANAEARKAYKRQWYQDKVDAEIAAGLRPPRRVRTPKAPKPEKEPSQ